ncbi:hypothetical protein PYW07_002094 [Mythimna separata]|uniref:Uncharacterized protein n=1 Tax=Mythimna separata TaxID=271217 RepID=A0AAD7YNI7_MYTSE|nr:hypothetical protein PYW07_002094 [Mythimna separata]
MYRLLILSTLFFVSASADADKRECEKLFDPRAVRCCQKTSDLEDNFVKSEDVKECLQGNMDPTVCEYDLCIAKKRGFATDDNKLDTSKMEELMAKDFGSDAELMKDLKSKCIDGDLNKYGPPEICDFIKIRNCLKMTLLKHCPEWNINDACNEFKGLVQECGKTVFS